MHIQFMTILSFSHPLGGRGVGYISCTKEGSSVIDLINQCMHIQAFTSVSMYLHTHMSV